MSTHGNSFDFGRPSISSLKRLCQIRERVLSEPGALRSLFVFIVSCPGGEVVGFGVFYAGVDVTIDPDALNVFVFSLGFVAHIKSRHVKGPYK